jgi:hypothetical protein
MPTLDDRGENPPARWMQLLPNAKLAAFEKAGHLVLDELEEARDCVAKFLA